MLPDYIAMVIAFAGCNTLSKKNTTTYLPAGFNDDNVLATYMGMTSDEVLKMYGNPKSVKKSVCGSQTPGGQWNCTTWEYGKFPYDRASFTFYDENGTMKINSFDIERDDKALPDSFTTENIMKVKQGVPHILIYETFGPPKSVSQSICGAATGKPWICTKWEYGDPPYANAQFTFSTTRDSSLLNDFSIERD